jgi:hypothetical protein
MDNGGKQLSIISSPAYYPHEKGTHYWMKHSAINLFDNSLISRLHKQQFRRVLWMLILA